MSRLLEKLSLDRTLVMDGAMGTELLRRGLWTGAEPAELLNHTNPSAIESVTRDYVAAGADVVLTNTFQAAVPHPTIPSVADAIELWRLGIERAARCAPATFRLATLAIVDIVRAEAVLEATPVEMVDGVLLETITDLDAAGRLLAKDLASLRNLPTFLSFAFQRHNDGRIVLAGSTDSDPFAVGKWSNQWNIAGVGINCGVEVGFADAAEILVAFRAEAPGLYTLVKPNAGTPVVTPSGLQFPQTPTDWLQGAAGLIDDGVHLIGGCCGTGSEHVRLLRELVDRPSATSSASSPPLR